MIINTAALTATFWHQRSVQCKNNFLPPNVEMARTVTMVTPLLCVLLPVVHFQSQPNVHTVRSYAPVAIFPSSVLGNWRRYQRSWSTVMIIRDYKQEKLLQKCFPETISAVSLFQGFFFLLHALLWRQSVAHRWSAASRVMSHSCRHTNQPLLAHI